MHSGLSRRMAFGVAVGMLGLAAGGRQRAAAQSRSTQQQADYQAAPKGLQMCGTCTLFISPDGCKAVDGPIDRRGWCKLYDPVD